MAEVDKDSSNTTPYTKESLENIFNTFIDSVFTMYNIRTSQDTGEYTKPPVLSKDMVRLCFQELMKIHNTYDAWDDKEFDKVFHKFEDDDIDEIDEKNVVPQEDIEDGFTKEEFKRLLKYVLEF